MNRFNYDFLTAFNDKYYEDVLLKSHITGSEMHVLNARDESGVDKEINAWVYPLKKDNIRYLLPTQFLNELPITVDDQVKISINRDAFKLITDRTPKGLRPSMKFKNVKDFFNNFCDFEHSEKDKDFLLWTMMVALAHMKRINVRVSSEPAFGKDSVLNVFKLMMGDVGIVHNPTMAKLEWLLTNRILVTNEVSGIQAKERYNLEQYYLTCGDFGNHYEKRSIANYKGALNNYRIHELSNLICYNNFNCYPERSKGKYFDHAFQKAVLQRFLPFKFKGKLTEHFTEPVNPVKFVEEHMRFYKDIIMTLNYISLNLLSLQHNYERRIKTNFQDRYLRNWNTILLMIDAASETQEEFDELCITLFQRHLDYKKMIDNADRITDGNPFAQFEE